jgi:NAD(P)H dehydrogenase (quinone)
MPAKILVTGAAGHLGRAVIGHLIESRKIPASSLIAGTRDPAKLADLAAKGVEVRKVDFADAAALPKALAGAGTALLISTDALGVRQAQQAAAAAAAKQAGVAHIAYTSMPNPEPGSPVVFAGDHYGTEQAIKATGLPYTIFRNSWYHENLLGSLPGVIASGKWFTSAGAGKIGYGARDDMAAAIAGGLAAAGSEKKTYTLTGPAAYSVAEIAALASRITDRPIEVVQVSDDGLLEGLKAAGLPEFVAKLLVSFDANSRAGRIAEVTEAVAQLSGRKPQTLEDFLEVNKAVLGNA